LEGLEGRFRPVPSLGPPSQKESNCQFIFFKFIFLIKILNDKLSKKKKKWTMTWQSFCHISGVAAVQFLLVSGAANLRELGALQMCQKTSNGSTTSGT